MATQPFKLRGHVLQLFQTPFFTLDLRSSAVTSRSPFLSLLNHSPVYSFSHTPQGQPNRLKTWRRIWVRKGWTLESLTLVQIDAPCSHTSKPSSLANELLICILFCTQTLGLLGKSTPPSLLSTLTRASCQFWKFLVLPLYFLPLILTWSFNSETVRATSLKQQKTGQKYSFKALDPYDAWMNLLSPTNTAYHERASRCSKSERIYDLLAYPYQRKC